jgi:uracil-DNA glycosylase family 4
MITNAVRCLPPGNKPKAIEINSCRRFLAGRIAAMPNLVAILCLGRIAHETTCRALGLSLADHAFAHGAMHNTHRVALFDTYHCSRYNMNTGRLTPEMFRAVIVRLHAYIGEV